MINAQPVEKTFKTEVKMGKKIQQKMTNLFDLC